MIQSTLEANDEYAGAGIAEDKKRRSVAKRKRKEREEMPSKFTHLHLESWLQLKGMFSSEFQVFGC